VGRKMMRSALALFLLVAAGIASQAIASRSPALSVEDMLELSAAVVVGTVENVDRTNAGRRDGKTIVSVTVADVLKGSIAAKRIDLLFVGGLFQGEEGFWPSGNPGLNVGQTYILFLADRYYVSPILNAIDSTLRVVAIDGVESVVDSSGRSLTLHPKFGLLRGQPVVAPLSRLSSSVVLDAVKPVARAPQSAGLTVGGLAVATTSEQALIPAQSSRDFITALRELAGVIPGVAAPLPTSPLPSELTNQN
jgi:hypothetical protein